MAETICAPHAPPSTPGWTEAALATGAAVIAGLMFGRKGVAGVAAGVAAVAGARLLTTTRQDDASSEESCTSLNFELLPQLPLQELHGPPDWVDHDAVLFSHVVPDASEAAVMLQEKTIPLLDDDGRPVDELSVHCSLPDVSHHQETFGPMIWEPGREVQSRSYGSTETVWFGLLESAPPPIALPPQAGPTLPDSSQVIAAAEPPPVAQAPITPQPAEPLLPAVHTIPAQPSFALPAPSLPPEAAHAATVPSSPSTTDLKTSPFLAVNFDAPPDSGGGIPFPISFPPSPLPLPLPLPAAEGPIITPRPAGKTVLPMPRATGATPLRILDARPSMEEIRSPFVPAQVLSRRTSPAKATRHLEPLAPTSEANPVRRWPLVLLLLLLCFTLTFLAADRWQNGALVRDLVNRLWFEPPPEMEQATLPLRPLHATPHPETLAVPQGPYAQQPVRDSARK